MRPVALLGSIALLLANLTGWTAEHSHHPHPEGPRPALAAPPSRYVPLPREDTLITGATLLDGAGGRLENADVSIHEGRILAAGHHLPREGLKVIDAAGRWLTPGLIDVHTHDGTYLLPQTAEESAASDVAEESDPNAADTWIEHAVRPGDPAFSRALAGGVTTLQILPGSAPLIGGRSVIVKPVPAVTLEQMRFPDAPQGLKMACGSNPAATFGGHGRAPNSRQGEIALLRTALLDAQRYAAAWEEYRSGREDEPPKRDLKLDTLLAARRGEVRVHLHCYRADEIANWLTVLGEFGVRVAAVHHATEAYKIAPLLAQQQVCAAVWPDWWGFKREAEDGIAENAAFLDAAGACVMLHSDIPLLGSLLNLEAARAAAAGRRAGLVIPPERAIRWITSNPAGALGLGSRVGRIAPGFDADLVLWSGDPFSVYSHTDLVFIDGALAYDRRIGMRRSDVELGRPQQEPVP